MKLFWKIYSAVFICFVLIVMTMSAFIIRSQIVNATESMIKQQKTVGSIMIDEIEKGYLVDKLPFQSLKFLTGHESFAFWWLVKPNGEVYLADDIKSIGIQAFTYLPQASSSIGDNAVSIIGKNEIVFIQTFGYGSNKMSFWLGFTAKDIQLTKNRIIYTTITFAFASLAVLGLMIYLAINHLIRPIQKLTVAAGKIGSGQFDCKVDKQSNDEIGLLADAFNKMTMDLKQTTTSIDNLNREISERKKAEENINTSQKLLQRIIDLLPLRVFWKDKNLKFLGCNEVFAKDAGENRPEDLIGKDDFQMNWKEQAKIHQDEDRSIMTLGKSTLYIEERQTTPKGDKILLKTSKVPLTDLQGNIIGILGTYEDITDRKQTEEALRASENRWQFALEGAGAGLWDWNIPDNTVFFTKRYKAMLGYEEHEISSSFEKWSKRIHPDDKEAVMADIQKHFRRETDSYQNEHRVLCKDGTYKWIMDRGKVIEWSSDEKPLRMIGTYVDITARKKAEDALFLKENIIKCSSSAIATSDLEGNMTYGNPSFLKTWGFDDPDEFLGRSFWEFWLVKDRRNEIMQVLRSEGTWFGEIKAIRKDGSIFDVQMSAAMVFDGRGNPVALTSTSIDITDRKQSEIKLLEMNR